MPIEFLDGAGVPCVTVRLAFDRSERWKDEDGHLHVRVTNLSKACVNPYRGSEIPGYEALGLDANRVYQLFRDPDELTKGAASFNNLRLMSRHVAVSADKPEEKDVAGTTGTDARFEAPYLVNSLTIWRAEDIARVESRDKCELSCGYYYRPDMTPGNYEGVPYDGVMRDIRGNHVALVEAGRAGPDVLVHDTGEFVMPLASRHAVAIKGALTAYLRPRLMPETVLAMDSILGSVNGANWKTQKPRVIAAIQGLATDRLAAGASIKDLPEYLMAFDEADEDDDEMEAMDAEETEAEMKARRDEEDEGKSAEDRAKGAKDRRAARDAKRAMDKKAMDKAARDKRAMDKKARDAKAAKDAEEDDDKDDDDKEKAEDRKAMDAAMAADIRRDIVAQMNAAVQAREDVRPHVGQVALAMDTAESIYKFALDQAKVPTAGVHPSAYRAMVGMLPKPGARTAPAMATDGATDTGADAMFPGLGRINQS